MDKGLGRSTWTVKILARTVRSFCAPHIPYPVFRLITKKNFTFLACFLFERALKIFKKILKIWKKSRSRVKIPRVEKKFKPMNLRVKILKKQPSGHFPPTPLHLADAEIQMGRPCNNHITTTNPNFPLQKNLKATYFD